MVPRLSSHRLIYRFLNSPLSYQVIQISSGSGSSASAGIDLLGENWDTVRVFVAAQTQWRYGPSGRVTGLDYAAAVAEALGIAFGSVLEGLRTMEAVVLNNQS